MKAIVTLILICFTFPQWAFTDQGKLEKLLASYNIQYIKISKPSDKYLKYSLNFDQLIDHKNSKGKHFSQQIILTHVGFDRPVVMETQGYGIVDSENELALALDANHLNVEHRYYGKSIPDSLDWEKLNFEQESSDLHAIREVFNKIYQGKWISTGISAGGVLTILYKYFYPNDVVAAVPYVAPIGTSLEEKRPFEFIDTVGTKECRDKIREVQHYLLSNEKDAIERVKWFCMARRLQFTIVGSMGKAFELAVLEYPFSFWQYGIGCENLPADKSLDSYLEHLLKVSDISFFSDRAIRSFEPHFYQVATENGYYTYPLAPFKEELKYLSVTKDVSAIFLTPRISNHKPYDGKLFSNVAEWLKSKANNIIYIYGGADPWTACRPELSKQVNSRQFILPGAAHAEARIQNMDLAMQKAISDLLNKFTNCPVDLTRLPKD